MARSAAMVLALFAVLAATVDADAIKQQGQVHGAAGSVAAVQKVIAMLMDLSVQCKKEKDEEQVAFAEFNTFCTMQTAQLKKEIEEGTAKVDFLIAEISQTSAEAKALGIEIAKLQDAVAGFDANKKEQEEQRATDHALYLTEVQDYGESVDALERAIAVMTRNHHDVPAAAAALLQVSDTVPMSPKVQHYFKEFLTALQTGKAPDGDWMDYEAPEANAYESHSGGIIETLKKLEAQFSEKKGQCEKEEMNSQHASNMIVQDLVDSIENANEDIAMKTKLKAEKEAKVGQLKGELESTQAVLAENKSMLADLVAECRQKSMSFEEKQRMRTEEIEAIEKAIEIMSGDPSSSADEHLGLAQQAVSSSLLQVVRQGNSGRTMEALVGVRRRVRDFLEARGRTLKSTALGLLAQKIGDVVIDAGLTTSTEISVSSGPAEPARATEEKVDPFAKVKKLIWDMIQKMEKEASADATHEGFCDTEIGKSKVTRNKLNEDLDALSAKIEELKAFIADMADEIANLSKEISDLQEAMTQATADRKAEKAKNKATIQDAQEAQAAVASAIAVLKDFYAKASLATAFVQQEKGIKMGTDEWQALANPNYAGSVDTWEGAVKVDKGHKAGMQTFGKTYNGQQESAGPILGLLEVIQADFANLESDTAAAEEVSQKAYEEFMADAKKNAAVKGRKTDLDDADKATAETNFLEATKDLKSTEDELLAADRYYAKLVPQCIEGGVTFEERTRQRESEIQSLKEALEILST